MPQYQQLQLQQLTVSISQVEVAGKVVVLVGAAAALALGRALLNGVRVEVGLLGASATPI